MVRYTRFVSIAVFALVALPGSVLAQPQQPPPPVPALPASPALPPIPPPPMIVDVPPLPDFPKLKADIERLKVEKEFFLAEMDAWKADMDTFKAGLHDFKADLAFDFAFDFAQTPKPGAGPKPAPKVMVVRGDNEDRNYQNGTRALDAGRWDEAVAHFTQVVNQNGTRADGAMYWIAWALNKQGNGQAALEWLQRMRTTYPESRWLTEGGALSVEIRQRAGQPVKPENIPDEELRLMALNSLARADEQRAVPMLEKIVNGTGSPRLKERALYVLAQNGSPDARQVIVKIARGGNPDLQARAVQHLGAFGGADTKQALLDIFKSSNNLTVKRNILRSFMNTGDRDQLLEVARTEPIAELRAEAVQQLGNMGAQEQLTQLYSTEKTIEVRKRIVQAMFQRHNPDALIQLLKTETEPELRRSIVQNLGQMGTAQGAAALQSLYASEKDESVRRAVIDVFANQRNVKVLIELSRKETDVAMKKRIVERLSQIKSPEATDYFMEILNQP
jgi:HEAT repeat protein